MTNIESSVPVKDHKEKGNRFTEVFDVEKQLWASVHSKGLLNADVQNLYRKACSLYEKILLGNNELDELQETEYSLWKLHYKHIDEYRKQTSQNSEHVSKNHETVLKGFKLFLGESSKFYQDLISKVQRVYDSKCRFLCHRLLVRVGDLARYSEVQEKQKNWSTAAKYYLEAAKMYPDGGNPHNQLAWLATYVGDEFLALYHCIRSLAVKEPFPDASNNLSVIFERNQSTQINSLSSEAEFKFLKPSEREDAHSDETELWPLVVRMTSYFFLDYSLECFSYTFGSTIRAMESLLDQDDVTLSSALDSYQNVNLSRPGPYRALQLVSVLIFTIQNLSKNPEAESMKLQMAFAVTFIIMGRVLDRCLKRDSIDKNPLLPSVLVFSEWLVENLHIVVKIEVQEKLSSAMSYFFSSYVEMLNRFVDCLGQARLSSHVALWEDYEMRGYNPVSQCHSSLDFLAHQEKETDFRSRNEHRVHRVLQTGMKLAKDDSQRWILYNKGGKFCNKEATMVEEEEDIVFKPITRYNSAPLQISEDISAKLILEDSNESLRRASSLLIAQNRALIGALTSASPSPPSLNAWVFNDDRLGKNGEKSILKPIDETDTTFDSISSPYCAPTPSAPLLPEDAIWISGPVKSSSFIHHSPPMLVPPPPEWVLLRKENQNVQWGNNHNYGMQQQQHFVSPWYAGNMYVQEANSRLGAVDNWGYPLTPMQPVYTGIPPLHPTTNPHMNGFYDQRREGVRADEQQQLLQYLKEKEMTIQQDAQVMHSNYTRNL